MVQLVTSKIKTPTLEIGQVCIVTGTFPEENKIQINGKKYKYRESVFEPYIIPDGTEIVILGEDKYFEEGAGQRKFLSKRGTTIQHYVTELENDPVYQVKQGKTYKEIWFYSENNVLPVDLIPLYEEHFGPIPTSSEVKVDEPAIIEKERVKFCSASGHYSSAASYLIVDRDGEHSQYYSRVCHGPINSPVGTEAIAIVYNYKHDWESSSRPNRPYLHNFWDYIVNRSPWAYAFLEKTHEENIDRGLLVSIAIHPMEVRTACMAFRSGWESIYAKRWSEYVAAGFNEDFALLACLGTTSMTNFSSFNGSHFPFGGRVPAECIAQWFANGREAFPGSVRKLTYRSSASSPVSADGLYTSIPHKNKQSIADFFLSRGVVDKSEDALSGGTIKCSRDVLLEIQEAFQSLVNSFKV